MSDDGDILEKERRDALIYGFSGEIHTGKFKLSRKEYVMLRSAIKSGNGILSAEMYYGSVYADKHFYLFEFNENGSITIRLKESAEVRNIHEDIWEERQNERSGLLHGKARTGNQNTDSLADRGRYGEGNGNNDISNDEHIRKASAIDRFSGAESERFDGRDRTRSDSDRESGGLEPSHNQAKQRFSIQEIRGEKGDYGEGVLLDTDLFDGIHPRNRGKKLREFVYNNLAGSELTMYDEDGNPETVYIAKKQERVRKDGANNDHKVIDKLARYRGDNIRSLATVHLSEALLASQNETSTDEHSHQWMDENGWRYRTVYLQDMSGNIYIATLNIADGKNGRILYDINNIRKLDNSKREAGVGVVPSAVSGGARTKAPSFSSRESIQQKSPNVKQKFSVEEETAEMDETVSRIAQEDPIRKEARAEADPAAAEKKRQKAEAKSIRRHWLVFPLGVGPMLVIKNDFSLLGFLTSGSDAAPDPGIYCRIKNKEITVTDSATTYRRDFCGEFCLTYRKVPQGYDIVYKQFAETPQNDHVHCEFCWGKIGTYE